ncbi:MAG: AAA family ATPase, partial [Bacteroidales bacterium]|nr:AAA family ATPase [Bacteroidales bacterium]
MIERTEYLKRLSSFKDKKVIKVITGIRRCGKSTLLQQYTELLKNQGVSNDKIIFVNLESARYDAIRDYHALYALIEGNIKGEGKYYVFIDEVQN